MDTEPNTQQRQNLRQVADYLMSLPSDYQCFDLERHAVDSSGYMVLPANAARNGIIANTIGHGPLAGIKTKDYNLSWEDYMYQFFGLDTKNIITYYLTGRTWRFFDNTHRSAAKRIYRYLDHGLPKEYLNLCEEHFRQLAIVEYCRLVS